MTSGPPPEARVHTTLAGKIVSDLRPAGNERQILADVATASEFIETAHLLRDISRTHSVVVVEHDMHFVRLLNVKVTCLHEGAVLAEGSIDSVSANDRVVEVYLGR